MNDDETLVLDTILTTVIFRQSEDEFKQQQALKDFLPFHVIQIENEIVLWLFVNPWTFLELLVYIFLVIIYLSLLCGFC